MPDTTLSLVQVIHGEGWGVGRESARIEASTIKGAHRLGWRHVSRVCSCVFLSVFSALSFSGFSALSQHLPDASPFRRINLSPASFRKRTSPIRDKDESGFAVVATSFVSFSECPLPSQSHSLDLSSPFCLPAPSHPLLALARLSEMLKEKNLRDWVVLKIPR
jgi:hypothetical protein